MGAFYLKLFFKRGTERLDNVPDSFLDMSFEDNESQTLTMRDVAQNHKLYLVVNIARHSVIGKHNFLKLQQLYGKYGKRGLIIMAFPTNQFFSNKKEKEVDIAKQLNDKYCVRFPIYKRIDVNGKNTAPLYKYLRTKSRLFDKKKQRAKKVPWNFTKFLVDFAGTVVKVYNPLDAFEDIERDIGEYLDN